MAKRVVTGKEAAKAEIIDEEHHEETLWPPLLSLGLFVLGLGLALLATSWWFIGVLMIVVYCESMLAFMIVETFNPSRPTPEEYAKIQEEENNIDPDTRFGPNGALWIFISSEGLFFAALIAVSVLIRYASGLEWHPAEELNIPLTALNTFVLLISSYTMAQAVYAAKEKKRSVRLWLTATILLGSTFLGIQVFEYIQLVVVEDFTLSKNVNTSTFFLQTGFHGAHVFAGLVVLIFVTIRSYMGDYDEGYYSPIERAGLYWHFVDVVWIFLFTILYLIDGKQTRDFIALCLPGI